MQRPTKPFIMFDELRNQIHAHSIIHQARKVPHYFIRLSPHLLSKTANLLRTLTQNCPSLATAINKPETRVNSCPPIPLYTPQQQHQQQEQRKKKLHLRSSTGHKRRRGDALSLFTCGRGEGYRKFALGVALVKYSPGEIYDARPSTDLMAASASACKRRNKRRNGGGITRARL